MDYSINGFYARYFKRILDFGISLIALLVLSPVLLILSVSGAVFMSAKLDTSMSIIMLREWL